MFPFPKKILHWTSDHQALPEAPIIDRITIQVVRALEQGRYVGVLSVHPDRSKKCCGCGLEEAGELHLYEVTSVNGDVTMLTHLAPHHVAYHREQFEVSDWIFLRSLPSIDTISFEMEDRKRITALLLGEHTQIMNLGVSE